MNQPGCLTDRGRESVRYPGYAPGPGARTLKRWIQVVLRGAIARYPPHYPTWMRLMRWGGRGANPRIRLRGQVIKL